MNRLLSLILLALLAGALGGCATSTSIFPEPGDNIATPSAMAIDVPSNRLYLVNSNSKVLYDWKLGSFQSLDITDPLAPVLIESTQTPSFSGMILLDTVRLRAFVPNRFSETAAETPDALFTFDIDQTSANYLQYTSQPAGMDAYGITCCYPADRAWITTGAGLLQYLDLADPTSLGNLSLPTQLDTGGSVSHTETSHIAIYNNQAFLTRELGGVMVVNLDKAGDTSAVAMDYFISDVNNPRGIATDGKYIYVVGEGDEDNTYRRILLVLDPTTVPPLTNNPTTTQVLKSNSGVMVTMIDVGQSPQEVLLSKSYAFVTNQQDNTVSVIDLASLTKITDITTGKQPFSLALYTNLAGVDKYMYVGNVEDNDLSIIDIDPSDTGKFMTVVATYP